MLLVDGDGEFGVVGIESWRWAREKKLLRGWKATRATSFVAD
jgi:hypothetical protein